MPPFIVGGEFIRVIRLLSSVQLEGGFSHWVFPLSSLRFISEHCLSYIIVQGDLWPLFPGP